MYTTTSGLVASALPGRLPQAGDDRSEIDATEAANTDDFPLSPRYISTTTAFSSPTYTRHC